MFVYKSNRGISTLICHGSCHMTFLNSMHPKVRQLYKQLFFMSKDYPLGPSYFRPKLKNAFLAKKDLSPDQIDGAIKHGEYVVKELEALYFLKKYRKINKNYPRVDYVKGVDEKKFEAKAIGKDSQ